MPSLNYHHLRYFWVIANEGNLTRAAEKLHVSQSALSVQLQKLEESFGQPLFQRNHKRLRLTEAGRIALNYAGTIFKTGDELMSLLHSRPVGAAQVVRVGAVATLSRNFQIDLLRSLLVNPTLRLVLHSGSLRELLARLDAHTLDLVLATQPAQRDEETRWHSHLLDEQPVSLVGKPVDTGIPFRFPEDLAAEPLLLPSLESEFRGAFDVLLERAGVRPRILAEVDDMAMLRLLARETGALTLVPPVVVQDELRAGLIAERCRIPELSENFFAITPTRRFPNPYVEEMLVKSLSARRTND